jgi:hypothetical protein
MPKYRIYAGLGGGFGGANYQYTEEFVDKAEANDAAYQCAIEEYESYGGMHGLMSWEEAREEAEQSFSTGDEDDDDYNNEIESVAEEIYNESMEGWLDYQAVLVGSEEDTEYEEETNGTG